MKSTASATKLRKTPRAFVEHLVLLDSKPALLTDLSLSGVRVQGNEAIRALRPNDLVNLNWRVLPQMKPFDLKLTCIWRTSDAVGLSFGGLDSKTKALIKALVRYHRSLD